MICSIFEEKRSTYRVLVGKFYGKKTLGNLGVDRKAILKLILIFVW